jgi:hypothetical protein
MFVYPGEDIDSAKEYDGGNDRENDEDGNTHTHTLDCEHQA